MMNGSFETANITISDLVYGMSFVSISKTFRPSQVVHISGQPFDAHMKYSQNCFVRRAIYEVGC
jgi:hypothetical protein